MTQDAPICTGVTGCTKHNGLTIRHKMPRYVLQSQGAQSTTGSLYVTGFPGMNWSHREHRAQWGHYMTQNGPVCTGVTGSTEHNGLTIRHRMPRYVLESQGAQSKMGSLYDTGCSGMHRSHRAQWGHYMPQNALVCTRVTKHPKVTR